MFENASFQDYFTKVNFDTSDEKQLSYFQNGYFSKKSFVSKLLSELYDNEWNKKKVRQMDYFLLKTY